MDNDLLGKPSKSKDGQTWDIGQTGGRDFRGIDPNGFNQLPNSWFFLFGVKVNILLFKRNTQV